MSKDELGNILIDRKYVFHLSDGRDLTKHGSWLLTTKDGHFAIDEKKCDLVVSYEQYYE